LQISLRKRAAKNRALLRKMTCKDKASSESPPPCTWWRRYCILCLIVFCASLYSVPHCILCLIVFCAVYMVEEDPHCILCVIVFCASLILCCVHGGGGSSLYSVRHCIMCLIVFCAIGGSSLYSSLSSLYSVPCAFLESIGAKKLVFRQLWSEYSWRILKSPPRYQ